MHIHAQRNQFGRRSLLPLSQRRQEVHTYCCNCRIACSCMHACTGGGTRSASMWLASIEKSILLEIEHWMASRFLVRCHSSLANNNHMAWSVMKRSTRTCGIRYVRTCTHAALHAITKERLAAWLIRSIHQISSKLVHARMRQESIIYNRACMHVCLRRVVARSDLERLLFVSWLNCMHVLKTHVQAKFN